MTTITNAQSPTIQEKIVRKRALDAVRPKRPAAPAARIELSAAPAAGAHAAAHLTNHDATPGCGALTSAAHASGREVDGGAG